MCILALFPLSTSNISFKPQDFFSFLLTQSQSWVFLKEREWNRLSFCAIAHHHSLVLLAVVHFVFFSNWENDCRCNSDYWSLHNKLQNHHCNIQSLLKRGLFLLFCMNFSSHGLWNPHNLFQRMPIFTEVFKYEKSSSTNKLGNFQSTALRRQKGLWKKVNERFPAIRQNSFTSPVAVAPSPCISSANDCLAQPQWWSKLGLQYNCCLLANTWVMNFLFWPHLQANLCCFHKCLSSICTTSAKWVDDSQPTWRTHRSVYPTALHTCVSPTFEANHCATGAAKFLTCISRRCSLATGGRGEIPTPLLLRFPWTDNYDFTFSILRKELGICPVIVWWKLRKNRNSCNLCNSCKNIEKKSKKNAQNQEKITPANKHTKRVSRSCWICMIMYELCLQSTHVC